MIVNESLARRVWPGEDAIGKRISLNDKPAEKDWLTVIAVAADIHQTELTEKPSPAIYRPYPQSSQRFFLSHMNYLVRTSSDSACLAGALRQALREVDPDQPAHLIAHHGPPGCADHRRAALPDPPAVSLFPARPTACGLGIYGVLAYSVAERTREIGIRMALGAAAWDVVGMVLRGTVLLVVCGIAVGIAGALAATRVLKQFLFGVTPTDSATFVAVALLLAIVALAAVGRRRGEPPGWTPRRLRHE